MPKPRRSRNKATHKHINRFRRPRTTKNVQRFQVHKRLALYPSTPEATWLSTIAWYGSIALKLFQAVVGVSDDLKTATVTLGAGTTIMLGPGDFAACSPVASSIFTSKDKEVQAMRAIPYERAQLGRVQIKIAPSVELGNRGGMYAAVILPVDTVDSEMMQSEFITRYPSSYDIIIKHPTAVMSPVTKPITLSINKPVSPKDVRVKPWIKEADNSSKLGWLNAFPQYALLIAYSDLAGTNTTVDANYGPTRSLFEVHLTGNLSLYEPGEMAEQQVTVPDDHSISCSTQKLWTTGSKNINIQYFRYNWDVKAGETVDLRYIDLDISRSMLENYNRLDLLPKLMSEHNSLRAASSSAVDISLRDLQV